MANHKSALKRIRQDKVKKLRNRYDYKSTRTAIKKYKKNINHLPLSKVFSMVDKLVKKNIIHINKASRIKSFLCKNPITKM